jgi:hypothetical protein
MAIFRQRQELSTWGVRVSLTTFQAKLSSFRRAVRPVAYPGAPSNAGTKFTELPRIIRPRIIRRLYRENDLSPPDERH